MKRTRIIGLAIVAVFALSAVAASAASAAKPEIKPGYGCSEKTGGTGEYTTLAECESETGKETKGGKFHRHATVKTESKAASKLENSEGTIVECKSNTATGTTVGTKKVVKTVVKFKGCDTAIVGECKTAGAAKEEIVTNELEGEIGYISAAKKEVGFDLWPSSRTKAEKEKHEFKALFVKFECSIFAKNEVRGSVIAQMEPVNKKVKTTEHFTLKYEKGAKAGEQKIQKLEGVEGGVKDVLESSLNGGAFKESNQQGTEEVKFEEEEELQA